MGVGDLVIVTGATGDLGSALVDFHRMRRVLAVGRNLKKLDIVRRTSMLDDSSVLVNDLQPHSLPALRAKVRELAPSSIRLYAAAGSYMNDQECAKDPAEAIAQQYLKTKGLDLLIRTLEISQGRERIPLTVVGISSTAHFVGYTDGTEYNSWNAAADNILFDARQRGIDAHALHSGNFWGKTARAFGYKEEDVMATKVVAEMADLLACSPSMFSRMIIPIPGRNIGVFPTHECVNRAEVMYNKVEALHDVEPALRYPSLHGTLAWNYSFLINTLRDQ